MEITDLKIGMPVRYESQKWKGTVKAIHAAQNEAIVVFEDDFENSRINEFIDVEFLRPY